MPVRVVHALEVIEVDHEAAPSSSHSAARAPSRRDALGERTTVEDLRQRIGLRELLQSRVVGHRALDHLRALDDRDAAVITACANSRSDGPNRSWSRVRRTRNTPYCPRSIEKGSAITERIWISMPSMPHTLRTPFVQRMRVEVFNQHRLSAVERRLELG
jgi:hypothetical protein